METTSCAPTACRGERPALTSAGRGVVAVGRALGVLVHPPGPPRRYAWIMDNVTDSLIVVGRQVRLARAHLSPVMMRLIDDEALSPEELGAVFRRVADTLVLLDDSLDTIDREYRMLADAGNLLQTLQCGHCETLFDVPAGPVGQRAYCSNGCRQAAYRVRAARRKE